jgi:hypothetical protein
MSQIRIHAIAHDHPPGDVRNFADVIGSLSEIQRRSGTPDKVRSEKNAAGSNPINSGLPQTSLAPAADCSDQVRKSIRFFLKIRPIISPGYQDILCLKGFLPSSLLRPGML